MFEPVASWSLPDHLYMVSAWSASCTIVGAVELQERHRRARHAAQQQRFVNRAIATGTAPVHDAWTDVTYLLYKHHVSWGYYIEDGSEPDCEDDARRPARRGRRATRRPGIWNPLPLFTDVQQDGQLDNVQPVERLPHAPRKAGTLPAVSWITPSQINSEHPPASVHEGQAWVTNLINAVMRGPDWDSTAIFLSWDDWGGFYDHVVPPTVDRTATGCASPRMVITPYAKPATSTTRSSATTRS